MTEKPGQIRWVMASRQAQLHPHIDGPVAALHEPAVWPAEARAPGNIDEPLCEACTMAEAPLDLQPSMHPMPEKRAESHFIGPSARTRNTWAEEKAFRSAISYSDDDTDHPKWNIISIIAFGLVLTSFLVAAIFGGGWWFLLFIAGLVLGIIGLIQVKHKGQRGKGFALAATLIVITFILTVLIVFSLDPLY